MKILYAFFLFFFSPCLFLSVHGQVQKAALQDPHTVYLINTQKALQLSREDSSAISQVFKKKATVLVLEAHPDSLSLQDQRLFVEKGFYKDHLKNHLPSKVFNRLDTLLSQLGHPLGHLPRMKPWLITQTLFNIELQRNGISQEAMLNYLLNQAATHHLQLQVLESKDSRKLLLANLPDKKQVHYLSRALKMHEQLPSKKFIEKEAALFPVEIQRFLDQQNKKWFAQIKDLLSKGQTPIIAIDYPYIQGEKGLIKILQKEGVQILFL